MRITFLHSSNDVYGASKVLVSDVVRLAEQGHDVHVVVPSNGPLVELNEIDRVGYVVDPDLAILRRVNPRDAMRWPHLPAVARTADLVVLWTLPLALYGPALRARGHPHVVSVHERADGSLGKALLLLALSRSTATQVNSDWVREWVARRVASERIVRTYPSTDWTRSSTGTTAHRRSAIFSPKVPMRILLIGRVSGHKGHLLSVEVIREMIGRGKSVHLTLAGAPYPGQERHLLELKTAIRPLGSHVTFVGEVPSLRSVAKDHDLLLMLPTRPEPFGITPLEAWQCDLPILGIPTGGAAESIALVDGMTTGKTASTIADDLSLLYDHPDGAWRHPRKSVPGKVLCTDSSRMEAWSRLFHLATNHG